MLSVAPAPVIFMHTDATDMRKSFTGLCGIIRGVFGDDPADGSLFLFVNKRRDRIKALRWDGDGFVIWYKRLEQGTFEVVPSRDDQKRVRIDSTQLAMILGGVRLESAQRRKRFHRALA
jgi:transposase